MNSKKSLRCDKCGKPIDVVKEKRIPDYRDIEMMLDLYSCAWYNRQIAAIALYDAMASIEKYSRPDILPEFKNPIEPYRAQNILRAKIFCEHFALLEAFGMLCIAVKNRNKTSFAWSFSNTEPQQVKTFYNGIASENPNSIVKLMSFLQISKFNKLSKEYPEIAGGTAYPQGDHADLLTIIKHAADEYNKIDGQYIKLYNKLKHGFHYIDGAALSFYKIAKDKTYTLTDITPENIEISSIPTTQESLDSEIKSITEITKAGAELMATSLIIMKLELADHLKKQGDKTK